MRQSVKKSLFFSENVFVKPKILYIDDSDKDSRPFVKFLTESGYEVDYFRDPEKALKTLIFKKYELAVVDCLLPKNSGFKLAETLQERAPSVLPVLFISGVYNEESCKKYEGKDYFLGFLRKPFDNETLLNAVAKQKTHHIEQKTL